MSDEIEKKQPDPLQQQRPRSLPACANSYTYSVLDGERTIRLLRFRDSSDGRQRIQDDHSHRSCDGCIGPHCRNIKPDTPHFQVCEVNVDEAPRYTAISYAWGSSELCETVLCDSMSLSVTQSCWELLQRLQRNQPRCSSGLYWIDAICINQKSIDERNTQVALMETVYIKAECVLVWPGYSYPSEEILKVLNPRYQGSTNEAIKAHERSTLRILEWISNPYFTRIWPIQEIALARNCYILLGEGNTDFCAIEHVFHLQQDGNIYMRDKISFSGLDMVRRAYAQTTQVHKNFRSQLLPHRDVQLSPQQLRVQPSISQLLLDIRYLKASESLDKIFAVQGMLKLLGVQLPAPDYNKNVQDVYTDATVAAMLFDQDLRVSAGLNGSTSIHGLPNWSPDWSDQDAITEIAPWEDHKAGGTGWSRIKIDSGTRELQVRGLLIDEVDQIYVKLPKSEDLERDHQLQERFIRPVEVQPEAWKDRYLYFMESLSFDLLKGEPITMRNSYDIIYRQTVEKARTKPDRGRTPTSLTRGIFAPSEESTHAKFSRYHVLHAHLCRRLDRKSLFATTDGRFGIASMHIQAGDSIVLLKGCNLPMVSRRTGQRWTLISPAYIPDDGIMKGSLWNDGSALQDFNFI